MHTKAQLAVLGAGNIGSAIVRGLAAAGRFPPGEVIVTRRRRHLLEQLAAQGFAVQTDNADAVRRADTVIVAVAPQQLSGLLGEIAGALSADRHVVISVVTGVSIASISARVAPGVPVVRAMPNTAAAIGESMTCLAAPPGAGRALDVARSLFDALGKTVVIDEEQMIPATALCACGVAFFLRAIRAASQGGIQIGFDAADALTMAAQTARGAASLLLTSGNHPETEIDRVTTPRGCTIAGLNLMEHEGFSSALIKGIVTSAERAAELYVNGGAAPGRAREGGE